MTLKLIGDFFRGKQLAQRIPSVEYEPCRARERRLLGVKRAKKIRERG
jgi:hypothetical protein